MGRNYHVMLVLLLLCVLPVPAAAMESDTLVQQETTSFEQFVHVVREAEFPFQIIIEGEYIEYRADGALGKGITVVLWPIEGNPQFQIKTHELIFYPEKKIVLKDVVYFEGSKALFHMPTLILPLYGEPPILFPEVGHNEEEGWFIKNHRYVDIDENSYGELLHAYSAEQGIGVGYRLHDLMSDGEYRNLLFYKTIPLQHGLQMDKAEYNHAGPNFQQRLTLERSTEHDSEELLTAEWAYTAWRDDFYTSNSVFYEGYGTEKRLVASLQYMGNITHEIALDTSIYQEQLFVPGGIFALNRASQVRLTHQGKYGTTEFSAYDYLSGLDIQGQLRFSSSTQSPLRYEMGYGLLHEDISGVRDYRTYFLGEYVGGKYWVGDHSLLQYDGAVRYDHFNRYQGIGTVQTNVALDTAWSKKLNSTLRWDSRYISGQNPFVMLQDIPMNSVSLNLAYKPQANVEAGLRGGYNLIAGMADPLFLSVGISGDDRFFYGEGRYNTEEQQWEAVSVSHSVQHERLIGVFMLEYDLIEQDFAKVAFDIKADIAKGWSIEASVASYYGDIDKEAGQFGLVRNLGSRELKFNYQTKQERIWLEYNILPG